MSQRGIQHDFVPNSLQHTFSSTAVHAWPVLIRLIVTASCSADCNNVCLHTVLLSVFSRVMFVHCQPAWQGPPPPPPGMLVLVLNAVITNAESWALPSSNAHLQHQQLLVAEGM